jgi:hypothetical protein
VGNDVFANGRELACKSGSGKSICAFPDVCMTPPMTPATPPGVPVPYPNTGMASDTTSGSTTVKISGKEVMLKNKSYFKSSTGDEAGCATKKGVVSSVNRGKVYFAAWSMDVKIEGENAVRHLDLTTHNHGSAPQTPPWPFADSMAIGPGGETNDPCAVEKQAEQEGCSKHGGDKEKECGDAACQAARTCKLVPKGKDKEQCCPPDNTGDHLIEDHWLQPGGELLSDFAHLAEKDGARFKKPGGPYDGAPCMCVNRSRYKDKHGIAHGTRGVHEDAMGGGPFPFSKGKEVAVASFNDANPTNTCSDECIGAQIESFYGPDTDKKKLQASDRKQPLKEKQREEAIKRVFGEDTM